MGFLVLRVIGFLLLLILCVVNVIVVIRLSKKAGDIIEEMAKQRKESNATYCDCKDHYDSCGKYCSCACHADTALSKEVITASNPMDRILDKVSIKQGVDKADILNAFGSNQSAQDSFRRFMISKGYRMKASEREEWSFVRRGRKCRS